MTVASQLFLPPNLLTAWSDLLLESLVDAGIREVVVSPGSRSTPFVLAAAQRPELRLHAILDERAAAFFALGLARATGQPPLLLCTSGTAPAHYLPALVEASEAELPLVVLSADRPLDLAGSSAPQTTDQTHLFGRHVRLFRDLGEPFPDPRAFAALRATAIAAVARALGPEPGPVHLNARARQPLERHAAEDEQGRAIEGWARAARRPVRAPSPSAPTFDAAAIEAIADRVRGAGRVALVAGPLPPSAEALRAPLFAFARTRGIALLAEAPSQLRLAGGAREGIACGDAFDLWLRGDPGDARPEVILEVGGVPTSAGYAAWLERSGPDARFVLGGARRRDPSSRADAVVLGDTRAILDAIEARVPPRSADPTFARAVRERDAEAWAAIEAEAGEMGDALFEGEAVRALAAALPPGGWLALGNSLPIRHADRFVPGGACEVRVLSQRGVNGIDGWVAGAAGAAEASGAPTLAIIGDVTLAHDVGSLALAARCKSPLAIAVLDNGGGRIFEQLPIAASALPEDVLRLFSTPPAIDFEAAARAFGIGYRAVERRLDVRDASAEALARGGATLLHVRVPAHGAADLERRIRTRLGLP